MRALIIAVFMLQPQRMTRRSGKKRDAAPGHNLLYASAAKDDPLIGIKRKEQRPITAWTFAL